MSDTRTKWAEDRTVLANERTYASWLRTGMACVALALGLRVVFGETGDLLVPKLVAELFILIAMFVFVTAARNCVNAKARMDTHESEAKSDWSLFVVSAGLTIGAGATGVVLWFL